MEWELQPERSSREGLGWGHAKAFGFIWKTPGWTEVASDARPCPPHGMWGLVLDRNSGSCRRSRLVGVALVFTNTLVGSSL